MARYRLYIDESGDHTYSNLSLTSNRYLALTGVILESGYYRGIFHPNFEALKQSHFPYSPDEPVVLIRSAMVNRKGPFGVLKDQTKKTAWEQAFLSFIAGANFQIMTVAIDKQDHLSRYGGAAYHPYHYCLSLILERYIGFLKWWGGTGDVLAESRGKTEDMQLKRVYSDIWQSGTFYHSGGEFQQYLTSKELKLKKKEHNIAGLQLADLLAAPSKFDILTANNRQIIPPPSRYTQQIIQAIRSKYNPYGRNFLA